MRACTCICVPHAHRASVPREARAHLQVHVHLNVQVPAMFLAMEQSGAAERLEAVTRVLARLGRRLDLKRRAADNKAASRRATSNPYTEEEDRLAYVLQKAYRALLRLREAARQRQRL